MIKQVIVMRKDLNMRKGKMVAQGAHASMKVIIDLMDIDHYTGGMDLGLSLDLLEPRDYAIREWINGTFTKIAVSCDSEQELLDLFHQAEDVNLPCAIIKDSGLTEFHGIPTNTCIAIGPANAELIDKITGELKLL